MQETHLSAKTEKKQQYEQLLRGPIRFCRRQLQPVGFLELSSEGLESDITTEFKDKSRRYIVLQVDIHGYPHKYVLIDHYAPKLENQRVEVLHKLNKVF